MDKQHTPGPYKRGYITGLKTYAHWKDGVQFVGTTGRRLADAIEDAEQSFMYDPGVDKAHEALLEALEDMLNGWRYIRRSHGDLYGVGWDRAEEKAQAAIDKATNA